ncbi:MAG: NAD(P)H-dependent oxidoreductase [Actinobacteria bacterium]|nr:NAD(P)H-dependent oxidoreductase [Actinomycetota bacterium]
MLEDRFQLAVIVGSVREGRFGPVVADWFVGQAKQREDVSIDVIDLADTPIPAAQRSFADRVGAADAFVVVPPEYNHSFPGPLKHAIDSLGRQWQAKPVGFVRYGGLRVVEALRLVFAELHAVTIRETVSFHSAWDQFDEHGAPQHPDLVSAAAGALLDQLVWWALGLRAARAARPYGT